MNSPDPSPWLRYFVAAVALIPLLYGIGAWVPVGADGPYMAALVEQSGFPMYYRSLLTLWLHEMVYRVTSVFDASGSQAIALSSSVAGAIALLGLWRLCPRVWFLLLNCLAGSFLVFCGHVENYAWVNAFLILSTLGVQRWYRGEVRLVWAMIAYALACMAHMLAIWYLPAMMWAWYSNRRFHPLEILLPILGFAGLVTGSVFLTNVGGTELGPERFVPWFETWAPNHYFTLFSPDHIEMLFYFHTHAAWLGVPVELPFLLLILVRYIRTRFERFLAAQVVCGLIWTTLWHPDWGAMDWDLFSQFAIPLHLLIGWLVCKRLCPLRDNDS